MLYVQRREEGVEHQLIMSNYGLLVCVVPGNSAAYPKDIPDAGLKTRVCQKAGSVRDAFRDKPCDQYLVSPLVTQGLHNTQIFFRHALSLLLHVLQSAAPTTHQVR